MQLEVETAANFLLAQLSCSLDREQQESFLLCARQQLLRRCLQGSWKESLPELGSANRAVIIRDGYVDPLIRECASSLNLAGDRLYRTPLTLWIDPATVVYRLGERGMLRYLMYQRQSLLNLGK